MSAIDRRQFIAGTTAAAWTMASRRKSHAAAANDTVVLAIVGANNRGSQLAEGFAQQAGAEIAYVCDCDERATQKGIDAATSQGGRKPEGLRDFRRALDDPAIDAVVCAAPNHWHAGVTILGCLAGKHVYVEKPVSHTPEEGERMIATARKTNRMVQVGLQRRSGELYRTVVDRVQSGAIGRALYAKSWYYANRPSIGRGKEMAPPSWLDFNLWQGPAPERPFRDNVVHYNWHFFWHWGNGELGNNGVHSIDLCRWALGVDYPSHVSASASKLRYKDDQETPDTCTATFDFDGRSIVWEGISWSSHYPPHSGFGMEFRGENGTIAIDDSGFTIYDPDRRVVEKGPAGRGDAQHLANFLDAIRDGTALNADVEEGHKSTLLCHLGNIAVRTGQPLTIDPESGHILNNTAAEALWAREYRKGWLPEA
jgi:predicted dehydrogenase